MCSLNVLLYNNSGVRKFSCFFGQPVALKHGNVHAFNTIEKVHMEISMYLAICLTERYMEISMYLAICLTERYMEISMYLASKHVARYMEISMYLATCLLATIGDKIVDTFTFLTPCNVVSYA